MVREDVVRKTKASGNVWRVERVLCNVGGNRCSCEFVSMAIWLNRIAVPTACGSGLIVYAFNAAVFEAFCVDCGLPREHEQEMMIQTHQYAQRNDRMANRNSIRPEWR